MTRWTTLGFLIACLALVGSLGATTAPVPEEAASAAAAELPDAAEPSLPCDHESLSLPEDAATTLTPMAGNVECRTCIGDCREDRYWCEFSCSGPSCAGCVATFNGCVATCHATVC